MCLLCIICDFWYERVDQIIRTQEFLAILKTRAFRSRIGSQKVFFWQLLMVPFGLRQCIRKELGILTPVFSTCVCYLYQACLGKNQTEGGEECVFIRTDLWGPLSPEWGTIFLLFQASFPQFIWLPAAPQFNQITGINLQSLNMGVHEHVQLQKSLLKNSFTEIESKYHIIHIFKVSNSMVFSIFTESCNHHHNQF